jgi:hypothetical protein
MVGEGPSGAPTSPGAPTPNEVNRQALEAVERCRLVPRCCADTLHVWLNSQIDHAKVPAVMAGLVDLGLVESCPLHAWVDGRGASWRVTKPVQPALF